MQLPSSQMTKMGHETINTAYCVPNSSQTFYYKTCKGIQSGARNVIPLIVHVTHFYYYKNI